MRIYYCKSTKIKDCKDTGRATTHIGHNITDKALNSCTFGHTFALSKFLQKREMLSFHINQGAREKLPVLKKLMDQLPNP